MRSRSRMTSTRSMIFSTTFFRHGSSPCGLRQGHQGLDGILVLVLIGNELGIERCDSLEPSR